jgi:prepilin-type N-terminal cleavage/methylation domain-containing protein
VKRGFTLVEVVVVIAILGITAAAVVPALARATAEDDLTRGARALGEVLDAARTRALERAISVRVAFVPETGRYWVTAAEQVLDSGAFALDPAVRLQSPSARPTFRFDPLGTADGDSVLLVGSSGARALNLDRWTGELRAPAR